MSKSCRACQGQALAPILDCGEMPLAGGFLSGREAIAREQRYPLVIYACEDCGLVQIIDPVDPEVLFQDYSFSSSTIPQLVDHFTGYAGWLVNRFQPRSVVEFGANDGVLVAPLGALGVKAVGVDISGNITAMAREKGLDIVTGYFNPDTARSLRQRLGAVDVVTGSNAFAHNEQPGLILEGADIVLGDRGVLCLEFMYAGDLLEQLQWDTLYHEHLTFYSLGTLSRLLRRYGFHVFHAERLPMHGGSLRIAASRQAERPITPEMAAVQAYEERLKLNDVATWKAFGSQIHHKIQIVGDTLSRLSKNSRIWGYGAAGKATLWVNAAKLDFLEAVVDASPLRAGKLMPGTHTPIVFPDKLRESPPDYIFVTAWNYADVIRKKESWFQGIWVTPLPDCRFF